MKICLIIGIVLINWFATVSAQSTSRFPGEKIDTSIISKRGLHEQFKMLNEDCDWSKRIGGKIDVFWLKQDDVNFFGYVYEYIMDCDNLRLIYWYQDAANNTSYDQQLVIRKLNAFALIVHPMSEN